MKYLVLEYSSHAYVQKRLKGLRFRQVNLTSLSSDHIEYHGSKAKYWGVKLDIIRSIINNSSSAKFFYNQSSKECLSKGLDADDVLEVGVEYGLDAFQGSSLLANVEFSIDQTKFTLDGQEIVSPLISSTNLNNILGIYVQLLDLGFDKENVLGILPSLERVKGRFEFFENSKFNVVLDYAHAEDSMENILKFFNQELNLPVVIVFGATGGGRDVLKRPRMGKVAEKYARKIILTSDDPYMDDPKVIAEDILEGISNQDIVEVEVDRRKAIYRAFEVSDKETLIVILGKAGEEVMMINGELIEFSDIKIVEDYLEKNV